SISQKMVKYSCLLEEGICREELGDLDANHPSLCEEEIGQLKEIGKRIEEHFGTPQDIEWILDREGRIWVLQTRPLAHPGKEIPNYQIDLRDKEVLLEGGITASPGASAGRVFVLRQDADTLRFQEGSILVTSQALPRLAPLLSRARGIIAELGSVTGHLANVAREFKVPALFGLKGALEVLEDGMEITLCADHRLVLKGIHDIKVPQERGKAIMEGTPVYETLKSLATHILPLTLLDPDSLEFHPKNVKTLHDITRFCHEKSVIEMFDFGNSHGFRERSSKQLICDVPMQFWVINLDDGFKLEPKGNHIHIEDITSLPMLALWKGMVKVPWKGPPALNTRGFMSILLEATQNPNLEAARSSEFAVKNYFMVSKNYCSLQSRFGFHFSSVEALLSERTLENYISFQFKGGA
ncbi:MAG: PEP-utilizing enzyme, partial [Desulfatiglandales bacterium]